MREGQVGLCPFPGDNGAVSEQPGRYQRSTGGFVGALVIAIAVILAFVAFRALTRDDLDVNTETVDYVEAVQAAQSADWQVVYPSSLPQGWRATSVEVDPPRTWALGFLTSDGRFVGVAQQRVSLDRMLETYVDENPQPGRAVSLDSSVGGPWKSWSDSGGDHALSTEVGKDTLLVYGSAPAADLERVAELLTTDQLTTTG